MEALTCFLPDADSWTLQVGGLDEDGGGVQSFRRKSIKAVLRQPGGDGDLMLSSTGGCRTEKTRNRMSISVHFRVRKSDFIQSDKYQSKSDLLTVSDLPHFRANTRNPILQMDPLQCFCGFSAANRKTADKRIFLDP